MSEKLYVHQTFIDYVYDKCTHFGMSTCQIWRQVTEGSMIKSRSLVIFIQIFIQFFELFEIMTI